MGIAVGRFDGLGVGEEVGLAVGRQYPQTPIANLIVFAMRSSLTGNNNIAKEVWRVT